MLITQIKLQVPIRLVPQARLPLTNGHLGCGRLPNSQTVFRADTLRHGEVAMASVLTIWCTTRQCEVTTGIRIDAEALQHLARKTGEIRMHRLRPGAFNQDRLSETRCGTLRSGRVNALPTPSTTTARQRD